MFRLEQSAKRTKNEPKNRRNPVNVASKVGQLTAPLETRTTAEQQEKTQKTAIPTSPNLFRVETNPILYFLRVTRNSNCTHVSTRMISEAKEKRTARPMERSRRWFRSEHLSSGSNSVGSANYIRLPLLTNPRRSWYPAAHVRSRSKTLARNLPPSSG
jgi:hypothetical protein